ncbi:hypothetical protein [Streptomyces antibioticus]|uniref:hypothetical protein n=1 Tax=Streptomyces antibioticus TaxID=1890 RepID=UPI001961F35D|nr:hypothetical protein [Streptomyces sp. S9]
MTTLAHAPTPADTPTAWTVLRGPIDPDTLTTGVTEIAARHHLQAVSSGPASLLLTPTDAEPARAQVTLRWQPYIPPRPDTLSHILSATHLEILLDHREQGTHAAADLTGWLKTALRRFHPDELEQITATMPLLAQFTPTTTTHALADWAVIFRDHYVENTLGFLLALQRAGTPTRWIYALAKGDRTHNRDRVHATLLDLGYASGLLDNTAINAPDTHATELAAAMDQVDAFIDAAHEAGRKVLVIDDGGLLAQGYGHTDAPRRIDAALELTVSGLKRITAAGELGIPVLNLARSQLKTSLGYPEIADSCLRRLRALLPAVKVTGRPVLVLGYGTLGSRLATALRHQGCQIHVADPDPLALIAAAEAGHPTYRTTADALRAAHPFLIVGTTGEDALTADDLPLLPDGGYLAPFATRDFSLLADPDRGLTATEIPGIGRRYRLPGGGQVTLLGDGRSLNLYEADAIPNQGYDAYRAGTLIAADALCQRADNLPPGIHTDLVDDIIRESGLYSAYYDTYLATGHQPAPRTAAQQRTATPLLAGVSACVVGYGAAGRLHAEILAEHGASLTIVDPKHQDLPKPYRSFPHGLEEMPAAVRSAVGLWSVCCPTADHLPVLRTILAKHPDARILLEKPACQGHEIDALTALLASHRNARVMVTDQYQHARALDVLTDLMNRLEPDTELDYVAVTFTKNRTSDIAKGRFIDRSYGVLGYEWLHMLAVLRRILPPEAAAAYLAQQPQHAELWATYDPRLFVSALIERSTITHASTRLRIELTSSIANPTIVLGSTPRTTPTGTGPWCQGLRPADDRHRRVTVHAGRTQFTAHLDPVTATGGWQLERNHHRVTAERDGLVLHDEVVHDSPLHTAILSATTTLTGASPVPEPDLGPLRRIASLAELLRAQQPTNLTEQTSA